MAGRDVYAHAAGNAFAAGCLEDYLLYAGLIDGNHNAAQKILEMDVGKVVNISSGGKEHVVGKTAGHGDLLVGNHKPG